MKTKNQRIIDTIANVWEKAIGFENWLGLEIPDVHALSGWARVEDCPSDFSPYDKKLFENSCVKGFFRPKALSKIDNNNGWNFIESACDLPTYDMGLNYILRYEPNEPPADRYNLYNRERFSRDNVAALWRDGKITHWRPDTDYLPVY